MSSKQIHRITLFKVPNKADVPACLEAYTKLKQDAKKVCTPNKSDADMALTLSPLPFRTESRTFSTSQQVLHLTTPAMKATPWPSRPVTRPRQTWTTTTTSVRLTRSSRRLSARRLRDLLPLSSSRTHFLSLHD